MPLLVLKPPSHPTEDPLRPAVGVNAPEYNRRRDLAPLAENRLLAVLFYAW